MARESFKPTRPTIAVLVFNCCSYRFYMDNPHELLLAMKQYS